VSASGAISVAEFKVALDAAGHRVREARDELCALDAAAGDGDLGATLDVGFAQVSALLDASDGSHDIGALLRGAGMELARKAPSTFGTLLAGAFLRAGKGLAGTSELPPRDVARFFEEVAAGVAERGRAEVGQRTVLDAMVASAQAAAAAADAGVGSVGVVRAAAEGAREGADATAGMKPMHGRAGWVGERAEGLHDAGAVAWAVFVEGLADGLRRGTAVSRV
jgi:phosphoenolpyruvate---glycerone phosphotransferase subunit DhaL